MYSLDEMEYWNGSQWSLVKSQAIAGFSSLAGVAAISANDIWAVGGQGSDTRQVLIEHWNGAQWSMVAGENNSNADNSTLSGVVAVSPTDVWAVGSSPEGGRLLGPTLTEHWNGKQWSLVHSPNFIQTGDNYLLAIARDLHSSTLWAVGYSSSGSGKDSTLIEMYS